MEDRVLRVVFSMAVLAFAVGPFVVFLFQIGIIPAYGEICSKNQYTDEEECGTYHIALVALWHFGEAFNHYAAAITALATAVLAVLTWLLWWSTNKLWEEAKATGVTAKQTAQVALDNLRRTHRAWVALISVETLDPLVFDAAGVSGRFGYTVKNGGGSPAIGTFLFSAPVTVGSPNVDPRNYVTVADPRDVRRMSVFGGLLVLPNETLIWPGTGELKVPLKEFKPGPDGTVTVRFSGYVGYQDEFGWPHATTFLLAYEPLGTSSWKITPKGTVPGTFQAIIVGASAY